MAGYAGVLAVPCHLKSASRRGYTQDERQAVLAGLGSYHEILSCRIFVMGNGSGWEQSSPNLNA